jgi:N-acyl-L-homoserine lactone synthetase
MVVVARAAEALVDRNTLRAMFEARKRVFVDLLKWDVPVIADRYEVDQFDDEHAIYLIVADEEGRHLASARLLKTVRPHILGDLFPELCAEAPPRGADIFEVTRFCLDRGLGAGRRLDVRNRLVSALADYALEQGIATYTGVAELSWLQQILAFGWRCRPLGAPRRIDGRTLGALRIDITRETPALLAANGIYATDEPALARARVAA